MDLFLIAGWPEEEIIESPRGAAVNEFGRSAFLDVWGFEWTANVTLTHTTRRAIVRSGDPVVALRWAMGRAREIVEEHGACLASTS